MSDASTPPTYDELLTAECATYYADPLGFVGAMFPWGQDGPLKHDDLDQWQIDYLAELGRQVEERGFDGTHPVDPIRMAVSSGHGIGKSVLVALIICWLMSTRPHLQGTVTADTLAQLEDKTWARLRRWLPFCRTAHWFEINSEMMWERSHKSSWFVAQQSSKEENSEAFAGQHAKDSTSVYIMDEASRIPDKIHEVAEGGLTDGEPMLLMFGNATRSHGVFHRAMFGSMRHRWTRFIIDSRETRFANKTLIDEWIQDYGEDSDWVRVRVRGLPPSASELQFIPLDLVAGAQKRHVSALPDDPLICGLDLARGGSDDCVFRFRRGLDGRSIKSIRVPGEQARDSMRFATVAADVLTRTHNGYPVAMLFVDATGGLGAIADRLRQLGHRNVVDVQFGADSPDPKYANFRAYMWGKMRDWLARGGIDAASALETDLVSPQYAHDKRDRLILESKENMKARGVDSPDDGDALALTFAQSVRLKPGMTITPLPQVAGGNQWAV